MSKHDEELLDLIAEEALIDRAKLEPSATLEDIGLDSIDLVSSVFAIEEKYGISIPEDAFSRADTLGVVLAKIGALIDAPKVSEHGASEHGASEPKASGSGA